MKAYCKDCKHLVNKWVACERYQCGHERNVQAIWRHSHFGESVDYLYERLPEEINKNNDCAWFDVDISIAWFIFVLCLCAALAFAVGMCGREMMG